MHIVEIERNIPKGYPKKVNIDGFLFPSIASVCKEYGISSSSVNSLKSSGMSLEEAISYAIDHVDELNDKRQERAARAEICRARRALERAEYKEKQRRALFAFNGKTYENFRRAVEDLSWENDILMNYASIKSSAKKCGRTLEEQLQLTLDRHIARKNKEDAECRKKYGLFHGKMMGEIYHEAVQMVTDGGLGSLSDEGASEIIADGAGISIDNAKEMVKDLIENERLYSHFDYENRESIRINNKLDLYWHAYHRQFGTGKNRC